MSTDDKPVALSTQSLTNRQDDAHGNPQEVIPQVTPQADKQAMQTVDPRPILPAANTEQANHQTSLQDQNQPAELQTKQPVNDQNTRQPNQAVNQTNKQAAATAKQTSILPNQQSNAVHNPRDPQHTVQPVGFQPPDQQSVPNQASQRTAILPTGFPEVLTSQSQDASAKPATKTPTEVRTVVAKKKQFQVQVLEEPQDGSATDLPVVPVSSTGARVGQTPNVNAPQDLPVKTNVPQADVVVLTTEVAENTKVPPVHNVAAPAVIQQVRSQDTLAKQPPQSINEGKITSQATSIRDKVPGSEGSLQNTVAQSQGSIQIHNEAIKVSETTQSLHTAPSSPTSAQPPMAKAASTPRSESPVVPSSQPAQPFIPQDRTTSGINDEEVASAALDEESRLKRSASTEARDAPQDAITVQSPITSHPPIHIPMVPSGTQCENTSTSQTSDNLKSEKSQKSITDDEKSCKHDDTIAHLTSSIQTQTSFDKSSVSRIQSKKTSERKTIEKSSSDECPPGYDDSDGSVSSEKSYSRQSSDSHSTHDMDVCKAAPKDIENLQAKVDVEHWVNQVI